MSDEHPWEDFNRSVAAELGAFRVVISQLLLDYLIRLAERDGVEAAKLLVKTILEAGPQMPTETLDPARAESFADVAVRTQAALRGLLEGPLEVVRRQPPITATASKRRPGRR